MQIVIWQGGRDLSELTRTFVSVYSVWVSQILSLVQGDEAAPGEGSEAGVHRVDRVGLLAELPGEDPRRPEGDARRHVGQLVDGGH